MRYGISINGATAGQPALLRLSEAQPHQFTAMGTEIGMNWNDQYKHPLWQKKRLEAMEFRDFKCQSCESEDSQLHVHHKAYIKGRKIWDYNIDELLVLCEECHKGTHGEKDVLNEIFLRSEASVMDCAALLFHFCGASIHPEDELERGLSHYNKGLMKIGDFAKGSSDFSFQDIDTVLSLSPSAFHELALIARAKR